MTIFIRAFYHFQSFMLDDTAELKVKIEMIKRYIEIYEAGKDRSKKIKLPHSIWIFHSSTDSGVSEMVFIAATKILFKISV